MNTNLKPKLIAALVLGTLASLPVSAAQVDLNGYFRGGVLMTSDGTRANDVGLMTGLGKFRLGNEQNTKIEFLPKVTMNTTDGVIARGKINLTHETKCTADWLCQDGDGQTLEVREGYVELENLPFSPGTVFWAGKRYSSSNTSSHQYDWEYIQYNGTGGGFDKLDVGFAKMDLGLYAFTPSKDGAHAPVLADGSPNKDKQGYAEDYSLNLWLKKVADSHLDLQAVAHTMSRADGLSNSANRGFGGTAVYNFGGFYGLGGGYSRATLQYGTGLAAGDSLGKNGWGWANLNDTKSYRFVLDGMYSVAGLDIATFAFYQQDKNYRNWTWSPTGWDRKMFAVGVRPYHQITKYFAMQYELGYEHYKEDDVSGQTPWGSNFDRHNRSGGLIKATIAPTIAFGEGFWSRPSIRPYVTYAKWDKGVTANLDGGYTRGDKTHTVNFGINGEIWF